jgi:hypothetical protein
MYSVSKSILLILFLLIFYNLGFSQSQFVAPKSSLNQSHLIDTLKNKTSIFSKTYRDAEKGYLPYYQEKTLVQQSFVPSFEINALETRELTQQELDEIKDSKPFIKSEYSIEYFTVTARLQNYICAKINAVRLNVNSGKYEVLVSYTPKWNENTPHSLSNALRLNNTSAKINSTTNSVLATGKWYKVGLTKEGVYKIDKAFLKSLGIDVDNTDPRNIRIYGNGGKLMPEKNSVFRYDDLQENAIVCIGESDGVLNDNDYILFYGQSTDYWRKVPGSKMPYEHQTHYFSDTSFYFITTDLGLGKRINSQASLVNTPNTITSKQDYYDFHEQNTINVVKSGREFYGEKFDINTNYVFSFSIPDAAIGDSVYVKAGVLSRANTASSYLVNFSGSNFTFTCAPTNTSSYLADVGYFGQNSAGGILNTTYLSVNISKQTAQAVGWLDKIEFNARRNLVFGQNQFNFRDRKTVVGAGTFAQYQINNNNSTAPTIWDVTDRLNIKNQQYNISVNNIDFTSTSDSLREYVAFIPSQAYTPKAYGSIPNQNLHGTLQADYIIVTHPSFLSHAQRIAKLHQDYDSLTYVIATTDQVYNEFSSGTPDIGGIRDFVRMLYYRPLDPTKATKYLMLLGDGSYKNKDINVSGNTALIPTYETPLSSSYTTSFVSDDYFGMMDIFEGDVSTTDVVDIGVGRLMVKNKEEADVVTSKIEQYYKLNYNFDPNAIESSCTTAENNYPQGDWRNWVCFIADDEDNNLHINDANDIADKVYNFDKNYNVDKIFLDSYVQYSTPGGDRYPDAVNDLNRRIERGALIVNYTGHGGELGLAEERIVEVSQILKWSNKNNLPLFVTATCEFSRFDDPDRTSAGEFCLLSEKGGAIGLMTTCRLAFSGSNKTINDNFYDYALQPMSNGKMPHLGDVYRLTKESVPGSILFINFVLLGDPALKLSYPQQRVYTSTVNSNTVTPTSSDTLKALSLITVTGYVGDKFGNKLSNFNGVVYSTVFDKEVLVYTLKNDPTSAIRSFKQQKNIIYKGKSEAKNGDFSFSFLVPKDISYSYGKGKISYYAHNGITDAQGYYDKVVVGGANNNATTDNQGPAISLFMNDERFVSGGLTNENPKVYAKVSDLSGINTIGTGIGHDIVAILDENTKNAIVLNDYYVSDINTFQSGKIRYPFNSLSEGNHTLSLKVWDVQNNSSSSTIDFVVANQADLALTHVLNYPNPFTSKTKFFIEHNQCCTSLKVVIQIYTISGKMVKSIVQPVYNEGFRFDGIEWDGKDDFGDKLARGVYIYKVSITDDSKRKADKIEKLVILN